MLNCFALGPQFARVGDMGGGLPEPVGPRSEVALKPLGLAQLGSNLPGGRIFVSRSIPGGFA